MDKRQRNILIWGLAWAGLLVLVLYSPVGSPDLYVSTNYNTTNQGIGITSAELTNRPAISSSSYGNSNAGTMTLIPTDYSPKSGGSYSSSEASSTQFSSGSGSGSLGGLSGFNKGKSGSDMASGSMQSLSYASSKKSDNGTSSNFGGVMSLSSDFTTSSTGNGPSVRQGVSSGTLGGTDPGGDPTGDPIPVGDGWVFLLILVSAYTVWKKIRA